LPEKLCRDQLMAPVEIRDEILDVVFVTPREMLIIDEIQLLTGFTVRAMIAPLSTVEGVVDFLYSGRSSSTSFAGEVGTFEEADDDDADAVADPDSEILHLDQPPPPGRDGRIIRLVNQILDQAMRSGASDIHLEP